MRPGIVITAYNEARSEWRERENPDGTKSMQYEDALSEKYEGNGVLATLDSVRASGADCHVVIVDDGSTDGCVYGQKTVISESDFETIRHEQRIGIGYSRTEGVEALPPDVDVVMFLDAHQRLSPGCLDHCAELALKHNAIVWPDTRGLRDRPRYKDAKRAKRHGNPIWTGHGAKPRTRPAKDENDNGLFHYDWIADTPIDKLSRTHALISPGYCLPLSLWQEMKITKLARGFGANEPVLWVGAYFTDTPILHTCSAMVRHLFRAHTAHYTVSSNEVYRNMALLAKRWFSAKSWQNYWYPKVFAGHLDDDAMVALNSDEMMDDHLLAQSRKKKPDAAFFKGLCMEPVPEGIE